MILSAIDDNRVVIFVYKYELLTNGLLNIVITIGLEGNRLMDDRELISYLRNWCLKPAVLHMLLNISYTKQVLNLNNFDPGPKSYT